MPTVLTFEEMRKLHTDQWIWVEVKDHPVGYSNGLYHLQLNRYVSKYHVGTDIECLTISVRLPTQTVLFDTSEQGWRIWSDKPTQEQMDNTGWDYSTWQGMHRCVDCVHYDVNAKYCTDEFAPHDLPDSIVKTYRFCDDFWPMYKGALNG